MSSSRRKDRAQRPADLEALAKAFRAIRRRAGATKNELRVGVTDRGRVSARTEGFEECGALGARTADDILDSFDDPDRQEFWEHPVWKGTEPDDLRRWFKEAVRDKPAEEPAAKTPHQKVERQTYVKPRGEGGFFQAANAVFEWELPLHPAEITVYLCLVRHANGRRGRVSKVSGDQIGRECGMVGRHARRIIAFLERVTMIETIFEGGAQGGSKAAHRRTNEYLVPWLTKKFTREPLVAAIEKARRDWRYNEGGVRRTRTRVSGVSDTGVRSIGHGCTNRKNRRTKRVRK